MKNYNLGDVLHQTSFYTNKALGQNFISDTNLLTAIVTDAGIESEDIVVEIGTGAGTLTGIIADKAKKVYSFEVDRNLEKVLNITLSGYENIEVIFKDVLRMKDEAVTEIIGDGHFKLLGNLPYYITTPLLLRFIDSNFNVDSITIMVQEEVARRIVAKEGTEDYSSITLAVAMWGDATITRKVSRNMFFPSPNVDSAVVTIKRNDSKIKGYDRKKINRLVRASFAMRRKTLANNLSAAYQISKDEAIARIEKAGFDKNIRGEKLSLDDYLRLSEEF